MKESKIKGPTRMALKYTDTNGNLVKTIEDADLQKQLDYCKERYAQVGLDITFTKQAETVPAGVTSNGVFIPINLSDGMDTLGTDNLLSELEYKAIAALYGTPTNTSDINIIYSSFFNKLEINQNTGMEEKKLSGQIGFSIIKSQQATTSNNAFISGLFTANGVGSTSANELIFILAHELAHIFTNNGHFGQDYANPKPSNITYNIEQNLLAEGGVVQNNNAWSGKLESTKRLSNNQKSMIINTGLTQTK